MSPGKERGGGFEPTPPNDRSDAGRGDSKPTVRPGVSVKPLPLQAHALPPECWWLRSQPWCENHLRRLAGAWDAMYGEAA